jgi:hypothetical protein
MVRGSAHNLSPYGVRLQRKRTEKRLANPTKTIGGALFAMAWLFVSPPTEAAIIAQFTHQILRQGDTQYFHLEVPNSFMQPAIFESTPISAASVGQTFVANAANDIHFDSLVARLTNGIDERVWAGFSFNPNLALGGGTSSGLLESLRFATANRFDYPDLAAYDISSIEMTIVSLGSSPFGPQTIYTTRFTFNGELASPEPVPEPSSLVTLGASALGFVLFRRRRRAANPSRH